MQMFSTLTFFFGSFIVLPVLPNLNIFVKILFFLVFLVLNIDKNSKKRGHSARAGIRGEGWDDFGNAQKRMFFYSLDVFLDAVGPDPEVKQTKVVFQS